MNFTNFLLKGNNHQTPVNLCAVWLNIPTNVDSKQTRWILPMPKTIRIDVIKARERECWQCCASKQPQELQQICSLFPQELIGCSPITCKTKSPFSHSWKMCLDRIPFRPIRLLIQLLFKLMSKEFFFERNSDGSRACETNSFTEPLCCCCNLTLVSSSIMELFQPSSWLLFKQS